MKRLYLLVLIFVGCQSNHNDGFDSVKQQDQFRNYLAYILNNPSSPHIESICDSLVSKLVKEDIYLAESYFGNYFDRDTLKYYVSDYSNRRNEGIDVHRNNIFQISILNSNTVLYNDTSIYELDLATRIDHFLENPTNAYYLSDGEEHQIQDIGNFRISKGCIGINLTLKENQDIDSETWETAIRTIRNVKTIFDGYHDSISLEYFDVRLSELPKEKQFKILKIQPLWFFISFE